MFSNIEIFSESIGLFIASLLGIYNSVVPVSETATSTASTTVSQAALEKQLQQAQTLMSGDTSPLGTTTPVHSTIPVVSSGASVTSSASVRIRTASVRIRDDGDEDQRVLWAGPRPS